MTEQSYPEHREIQPFLIYQRRQHRSIVIIAASFAQISWPRPQLYSNKLSVDAKTLCLLGA